MDAQEQLGTPLPDDPVEALAAEASGLTAAVEGLSKALKKYRKFAIATGIGLILDVALTIVMATILSGQAHTNQQLRESLRENYVTAQQQMETRVSVLCPLYEVLLVASAQPSNPPLSGQALKARNTAIQTIKTGYTTLGCQPPLP